MPIRDNHAQLQYRRLGALRFVHPSLPREGSLTVAWEQERPLASGANAPGNALALALLRPRSPLVQPRMQRPHARPPHPAPH